MTWSQLVTLQDEKAIIYILTEVLDPDWLGDFKATVVYDVPTRANISALPRNAPPVGGAFFGCVASEPFGDHYTGMRSLDRAVTGDEIKSWASTMHPSSTLTVILEACRSGNFMNLPYEFTTDGMLIPVHTLKPAAPKGPRIISISACRKDQNAYFGLWEDKKCGVFTLMFKCMISERLRKGRTTIHLKDIERLVAPDLERWDHQHPVISISHAEQDALFFLS
ncbi:hypothetical protein FRB93_007069 [Tulasnella sp. JGI-2019a]|nr:hypothetical protein FRB93_007069 [Tulasnella sp. JGI-2019a]